jgi:hypothetical protein
MFHVRRVALLCVVALAHQFALTAAGAATYLPTTTTTTVPAPTTTVPAPSPTPTTTTTVPIGRSGATSPPPSTPSTIPPGPPPFALPTNYGVQLVLQQSQARKDLAAAQSQLSDAQTARDAAQHDDTVAHAQLKTLNAKEQDTEAKLTKTRQHLRVVAAQAYMHANGGELEAAVSSLLNSRSAVEVASQLHMISAYGSNEKDALSDYLSLKRRVDSQISVISDLHDRTSRELTTTQQRYDDVTHAIADAQARIKAALEGIAKFEAAANSASSPILGPSRLSANQMADYVMSTGAHPSITVPLVNLAQSYLDEGVKTGVRGDVAFAQSILETGGFANPGAAATDNNFAGIGWCDSCKHGFDFPSADIGVRAQLQLLRTYVDPKFPEPEYTDPILLPGTLSLGFRGRVQTWWDLWGTWATGAFYGERVYDIYERMVLFSGTDPAKPPPKALPAPAKPATTTPTTVGLPADSGPGTKKQ